LTPRHRGVAVEDQSGVRFPLANETLLPGAAHLTFGPALSRMERRAPAAAEPHAVVLLGETGEGIPSRGIQRPDLVLAHRTVRSPAIARLAKGVYVRPSWQERASGVSVAGYSTAPSWREEPCLRERCSYVKSGSFLRVV